jgi:hypothetical protein
MLEDLRFQHGRPQLEGGSAAARIIGSHVRFELLK